MTAVVINAECYPRVRAGISIDDLEDPRARDLFIALEEAFRVDQKNMDAVLSRVNDQALRDFVLGAAASGEFAENGARLAEDGVRRARLLSLERKRAKVRERIAAVGSDGEGLSDLQYEMMHLDAELAKMKGVRDDRS
jgi:DNA primase